METQNFEKMLVAFTGILLVHRMYRWAMGIEDILFLKWKPNKIFILLSEFIFWPGLICGFADRESGDLNLKLISNF